MRKSRRPAGTSPLILVPVEDATRDLHRPLRPNDLVLVATVVDAAATFAVAAVPTTATGAFPKPARSDGQPPPKRIRNAACYFGCGACLLRATLFRRAAKTIPRKFQLLPPPKTPSRRPNATQRNATQHTATQYYKMAF